jgi:hypothetical protein
MTTSYFSTITNESAFKTHFQQENGIDFMDIRLVGASEWGRGHLFACRVIRRPTQRSVLPVLSKHTRPSDSKSSSEIINFVNGPPDLRYMTESEHQLVRKFGYGVSLGQTWAALAMFKNGPARRGKESPVSDDDNGEGEDIAKRVRRNTLQEDYIDSGTMQVDSSSPREISSQETSSAGYVDCESHMLLASPEDETLRLASCVIRHILYFGAPQDSVDLGTVVEFRDAKVRIAVQSPLLNRKMVAIDDGGLCLRKELNGRFELIKNHVAILEGKRQFQCLEDGRPVISDDCLAQMTCEALVVAVANRSEELHRNGYYSILLLITSNPFRMKIIRILTTRKRVIVINAIQHYMCFVHFEISKEYFSNFESLSPSAFLYVNSTPWFDLDSQSGRKQVVANLCGLMRRERDA